MVAHSRATLGAHSLRALNLPSRLTVVADEHGFPLTVRRAAWPGPRTVTRVQDVWRIDDEWWREQPISRLYYLLLLDPDSLLTIFHDLIADAWYEQRA
jgi:hypothetical protein